MTSLCGMTSKVRQRMSEPSLASGATLASSKVEQSSRPKTAEKKERSLFVGNLSEETTQKDVLGWFSTYGVLRVNTIKGGFNGGPRYTFVEFQDKEQVDKVLQIPRRSKWPRGLKISRRE